MFSFFFHILACEIKKGNQIKKRISIGKSELDTWTMSVALCNKFVDELFFGPNKKKKK